MLFLTEIDDVIQRLTLEQLYYTYRASLFLVAKKILHNDAQAEDAVQNAFLKIIEKFQKIPLHSCNKTKAYLVMIVRNSAYDLYRSNQREPYVMEEAVLDLLPAPLSAPHDVLFTSKGYEQLVQCIHSLPPQFADVLALRYLEKMEYDAIADLLQLKPGSVRSRISRGRQLLLSRMEVNEYEASAT